MSNTLLFFIITMFADRKVPLISAHLSLSRDVEERRGGGKSFLNNLSLLYRTVVSLTEAFLRTV